MVRSESAMQFAASHTNVRFEFFGTMPAFGNADNVRQIVPNIQVGAYLSGWLAGEMAAKSNLQSIGFVPSTAPQNAAITHALLAGVYDADPTVNLVPALPTGVPPLSVPAVDISNGPVKNSDFAALQSQHAFLASLDFGGQSAVELSLPQVTHLTQDVAAFVHGRWQSGTTTTTDAPILLLQKTTAVPGAVQNAFTAEENFVAGNPQSVQAAWNAVPKATQAGWNTIAGS